MGNTNNAPNAEECASESHMFRRDTKTQWTQKQLLQYQSELEKELERQTHLANNNRNSQNTNIFTCCVQKSAVSAPEQKTQTETETETQMETRMVRIIDIDTNGDEEESINDTTNAFLELLQLDTMSKYLEEMRDRRMFLEKAANDQDLPEEEREIAAWITDTYLCKSPTTNYTQTILQNIINNKQKKTTELTELPKVIKTNVISDENVIVSNDAISDLIAVINPQLSGNDRIVTLLQSIDEWNFSVFEFVEQCQASSLSLLMVTICRHRNICIFDEACLVNYMNLVSVSYLDNPYHNVIHASDVLLNLYYFMRSQLFGGHISVLDCFSILISASVHDIGHPGHGNSFEINTESPLAITYNDTSVLENMHISLAWNLLKKKDSNFLLTFSKTERKRFRKVLIDSVLATDMSQHSLHSETLEKLVETYGNGTTVFDSKFSNAFLPIALHTADLGNLCKEVKYYQRWVDRLMDEFFTQGDKERQLGIEPISFLCDRFKVNIHSGQVGFINFVIRPWFVKFGRLLSEPTHNQLFLSLLNENLLYMQERANQTKDAQEEIKKNQHKIRTETETETETETKTETETETEIRDTIKPLPKIIPKPNIIPIAEEVHSGNGRTSKSYSIVGLTFGEMKSKLLEYDQKELKNKEKQQNENEINE